ncbi:5,10-methylenetetrahydromethanopterin reductase [Halospeciosus flavus]|uniref:5,10-methylenetetrahydromethanopterin reductase n=1 Tax=Halospeciosus flavus TaxID=3032283 RepID=A0ABD5Z6U5_9EURY|nr:5,10-methylenetetrahydromethanopterin reductase [Halospeciosus flavus]
MAEGEGLRGIELTPELPVDEVADLGAAAEAAGFDTVFASGHYFNRDPMLALDRVAAATDDVALGPGVANPYDVHPVKLATQVGTLDEVSDGRAVCGVGAGDRSTLLNLGVERDRPLRRVLETMKVSQKLWAGDRVDHEGTFTARNAGLNYDVGEIPVYVGAQGPHMLQMAAKHADGVLYNASHPDDVAWAAERVAAGREQRPDSRGEFEFVVFASVSVAEERAAAREAARPPVAFITAGAEEAVLQRHDIAELDAARVAEAVEAGEYGEAAARVTEGMLDAFAVAGTPDEVAARLSAFLDDADGFVAGSPLGPDRADAIDLLGDVLDRV